MPRNIPIIKSFILNKYLSIFSISFFDAQLNANICSLDTSGSPKSSFLKQYSINGFSSTVPSSIPNLFVKDPVAMFLTINSIGIISTNFINCSRMLILFTK